LFPPQKNISRNRALDPGEKSAVLRQKTYPHITFGAKPHQIGAATDISEANNPADGVNGYTEPDLSLYLDYDRFSLFGEVGPLCGHKKGVEMFSHGSPNIRVRYVFTERRFWIVFGRHSDISEQLSQRFS
jgi:hypothetical protein